MRALKLISLLLAANVVLSACQKGGSGATTLASQGLTANALDANGNSIIPQISGPEILLNASQGTWSLILPTGFTLASAQWNFGDGSQVVTSPSLSQSHAYHGPKLYTILVAATGSDGSVLNLSLEVNNIAFLDGLQCAPQMTFTAPTTGQVGIAVPAVADVPACMQGLVSSLIWDFGDSSPSQFGQSTSHFYNAAGNYLITLQVYVPSAQTNGAWLTLTQWIQITDAATPTPTPVPTPTPTPVPTPTPTATPDPTPTPTPTPVPTPTPTPVPTPTPTPVPTPTPTPVPTPTPTPVPTPTPTPVPTPTPTPVPTPTPTPVPTPTPTPVPTPTPTPVPTPTPTPVPTPTPTPVPTPTPTPVPTPTPSPTPSPTPVCGDNDLFFPVKNLCSDARTQLTGSNVTLAKTLEVDVLTASSKHGSDNVVCSYQIQDPRASLIASPDIDITPCAAMQMNQNYQIVVVDPDRNAQHNDDDLFARNLLWNENNGNFSQISVKVVAGQVQMPGSYVYILFDTNTQGTGRTDDYCNMRASPLVIRMNNGSEKIHLTAPWDGVMFDILGGQASPVAHTPIMISWVKNVTKYMFLAKPNSQGQVKGIDELFGDNTMGPDGNYASNGYAALAKYDGKDVTGKKTVHSADGKIDCSDGIFSALRVWSDVSHDAGESANELMSLSQAGISSISLKSDASFLQRDKYGNITTLRGTVNMRDGSTRNIFDLWFAIGKGQHNACGTHAAPKEHSCHR